MKTAKIKATSLRTIMSLIIIITIILTGVGFYYAQNYLRDFANSIAPTISKSTAGNSNPQAVKNIQEDIAEVQAAADRANSITNTLADYQNQMVKDLNKYAANNNMSITDYKFTPPVKATNLASGIESSSITITLSNPIPFTNLMKFFKSVESNIPKMQITGVSLNRDPARKDSVSVEPLTIETYIK